MGCLAYHPMWKESNRIEREARLQKQSEDAHSRGSQDALPLEHVVSRI